MMVSIPAITNKLESPQHLPDCEESKDLTQDHTPCHQILTAEVPHPTKDMFRGHSTRVHCCLRECAHGTSDGIQKRLEIRLESLHVSAKSNVSDV